MIVDGAYRMNAPRILVIALALMLFLSAASVRAENQVYLERFKLKLTDGRRFEGNSAIVDPDRFAGITLDGDSLIIDRDDILALYRQEGSYIAEGFAIGAGVGIVGGVLYNTWKVEDSEGSGTPGKGSSNVLFGAVAGGAVGGIVGSLLEAWKKVKVPLEWTIRTDPERPYLSLSLRF
jgi:hypothetical protein